MLFFISFNLLKDENKPIRCITLKHALTEFSLTSTVVRNKLEAVNGGKIIRNSKPEISWVEIQE